MESQTIILEYNKICVQSIYTYMFFAKPWGCN